MEEFDGFNYSFCDTCKVTKEEWKKEVARLKRRYIFLKQKVLRSAHSTITALSDAQSKLDIARNENKRLNEENVSVRERLRQKLLEQKPLEEDAKQQKESLARLEADLKRVQDQNEATVQHNRQLSSLVADRDVTIKKLRESAEELKASIAALKKELTAVKAERESLLKKNLKTVHHSIKLCEILQNANLLPKYYKLQLLKQWKRQVNRNKSSDGELLEQMLLSPDGVNSLCSQDTGFDSEEFCASDSDQSVRNEGLDTGDSLQGQSPSPLREETIVEESEEVKSVTWHSNSAKGSVVCSVEKTSRTSCEVFKVNEKNSTLLSSIFEPSDSEGEELSLILSRTQLQPLLSPLPCTPLPRTPIREICRTLVDVSTCTVVETSSVAVGYDKVIGNSHSEETQTDFILDGCLSLIPRMSQNTDVPDDRCNVIQSIQSSSCKETQTEGVDVTCVSCGSSDSRSGEQSDKDPSCAQFRTYNTGMIRVDYLSKDNSRPPSCDRSPAGYVTEDYDVKVIRTFTRTRKLDDDEQSSEGEGLAQLPWRAGPRTQVEKEPLALTDGLGVSDGENSLHLLSDGGGMYNSNLDSRDTEELQKSVRKLPSRRRFRTEIQDISEVSENENSGIISDGSEVQENEMDDVSPRKHIRRPNKYKRMKLSSGNVDTCYDSEEHMENAHNARLCSRRVASTNERKRHAWDQREGMHQRDRRYGSARFRSMYLRSYPNSRSRSSKLDGLGSRNSHNTTKFKKHEMSDLDDRGSLTYTRVRTRKITRHMYSPKELGKCKVSKYEQNQRVGDYINRFKDTGTLSPRSVSPDSGAYVLYNSNLDSDSHHSSQRGPDAVKEKYNKYSVSKYQKGRKRNVSSSEAIGRSAWNYMSDEAEDRNSDILDNLSDDPEVLLIGSSDEEERYRGRSWRRSPSPKSSCSTLLPEKVLYLNQKYMQQFKNDNKSLEIQNRLFSMARSIISKTASSKSQSHVRRMFEKKKGETYEHCCHHCACPSFKHDLCSQRQTTLRELQSSLNMSLKNSSLKVKAKKKFLQNRINKKKSVQERKRQLQELLRQQILTNRKAWLNKQSLSSQECGNSVQISSQNVPHISESASTSSDCLETVIAPQCNISRTSKQGMNVTEIISNVESRTDVGENDENNLHSSSNADQNVETCVSSSKMCSEEENFFGSDLESVRSSSPTDPNISVPCNLNSANDIHAKVSGVVQTVNSSLVSPAGNLVEKPLEDSVNRHNFSSVLGSTIINSPAVPALKVQCDPLVYRCDISPIKNSDSLVTPIKNSRVNLLSSTLVCTKSNDVHSTPEANIDGPLGLQKESLNNLDFMNSVSPLQKSTEPANSLDCSAVNKPIKDVSSITTDTDLAAIANLLDHSAVNKSPNRDVSRATSDTVLAAEINLLDHSAVSRSPNRDVSRATSDTDLGAETNLLDSLAINKSPNKDVSGTTSDTNLASVANLFNSSALNKSPNKDDSGTTSDTNLASIANLFNSSPINKSPNKDVPGTTSVTNLASVANLLDSSAVNKSPNKDVSGTTSDTNLASLPNLFNSSALNKSPNKDDSGTTSDTNLASIANLFNSSPINKSPNKDVSGTTSDTNLASTANLFNSLAVNKSPNKDVSGTTSAVIANKVCDNYVPLLTPVVNYSTRIQTHLPVIPVQAVLTELNPAITKPTAALVNKKSLDHNRKSPVGKSSHRSVNKNIFGSDLESLNSSDSEDERPLLSRLPVSRNQSKGKSVEDSFDQKNTSLNSEPPDRDVLTKQPDKLCSKSETSEFTGAGTKEREKLGRTCHSPPPILTDERASPLLNSSIAFPTVRRIAHQPKTYSALRKTRSLETSNVPNKSTQGSTLAVERLQQSDLLAPCPLPPKNTTKSLCKPYPVRSIVKVGKKLSKAMAQAKKIAECYKVPKLHISAVSTQADARDSDGKRSYISSIVSSVESPSVVDNDVKGEKKGPKLTPAAFRRLRAAEVLKHEKMKTETQAKRKADSTEGTITQVEINKSNIEKEVDTDKDKPEKDHCIKGKALAIGNIPALASKETEQVEPLEFIPNDKSLESSNVKVNNKREISVSLDSAARGRRSGRKNLNPCSKPQTPSNDIELIDLSSVPDDSPSKGQDNSSISPASPEIPPCPSPVQKPSVIPASPMSQCDGDSPAVLSPPSSRRCVQVLRLAMSMYSTEKQNYNLARQRTRSEIRAGEKTLVRSAFDVYMAAAFNSDALSSAVQKLVTVSDVKIVAKCVIKYAADDKSQVSSDPPAPPLSNGLKRLLTLMLALQREGPQWQILTEHVLGGIEYKLFRLGHSIEVNPASKLTLLYTSLCRIIPDRLRVQNFCLMALYSLKYKAHAVIYAALTVLPEALPMADVGDKIPLVQCLVYLVLHHSSKCSNSIYKVTGLKTMLHKVFGYKSDIESPPHVYLRSLIEKLKRGCLDVSPAIILFAKRKEWLWTMKFIVNSGLEPILQEWEQGTVSELVATETVKLIGYILKCFPPEATQSKSKVLATINHFEKLLLDNTIDSHAFKETVASALVCLSKFQFMQVVSVFQRWQPKQPVSRNLCSHLQVLMRARSYSWWRCYMTDGDKSPMNNEVDNGAECSEEKN